MCPPASIKYTLTPSSENPSETHLFQAFANPSEGSIIYSSNSKQEEQKHIKYLSLQLLCQNAHVTESASATTVYLIGFPKP